MDSLKLKHISSDTCKIIKILHGSQNILRYIHYLTDAPLESKTINREGNLVNQPDINITFADSGIEMFPLSKEIVDKAQVKLLLNPYNGDMPSKKAMGITSYELDIVCHDDYVVLVGLDEYRDFNIAYEISKLIDHKNCAGIGDVDIRRFSRGRLDDSHICLTLFIDVNNMSTKSGSING